MRRLLTVILLRTVLCRGGVICAALLMLFGIVNLRAHSASGIRAICLVQENVDHALFPLAISDSEAGAKWCQQEIGLPPRVVPREVVSPVVMAQFLADLRTVVGSQEKITAGSSSYKIVFLQSESKREMILSRPITRDLIQRFVRHCKGSRLHNNLVYAERQLMPADAAGGNRDRFRLGLV